MKDKGCTASAVAPAISYPSMPIRTPCAHSNAPCSPRARSYPPVLVRTSRPPLILVRTLPTPVHTPCACLYSPPSPRAHLYPSRSPRTLLLLLLLVVVVLMVVVLVVLVVHSFGLIWAHLSVSHTSLVHIIIEKLTFIIQIINLEKNN